jgi:hypothetical protein
VRADVSGAGLSEEVIAFKAGDGLDLNLHHVWGSGQPHRGPVLLVHGAGVRANIFRAPVPVDVVSALVEHGYDVWLENWRASIDLPPQRWNLDQAAVHDHPAAVRTVLDRAGAARCKALVHCQGSTSFVMSSVAGLLPAVDTIVSNAVSLHPVVPPLSVFKLRFLMPVIDRLTRYLNPRWGVAPDGFVARLTNLVVRLFHHECDNLVCRQVSFTYGAGRPALWRHEQLNDATHEWLKHEFAAVPLTFFEQMARCVRRGAMVSLGALAELPADFGAAPPRTDARFALLAGRLNLCFLPDSQVRTYEYLKRTTAGPHTLHLFDGYSHLDVFMGKNAARDTFPTILAELDGGSRPTNAQSGRHTDRDHG